MIWMPGLACWHYRLCVLTARSGYCTPGTVSGRLCTGFKQRTTVAVVVQAFSQLAVSCFMLQGQVVHWMLLAPFKYQRAALNADMPRCMSLGIQLQPASWQHYAGP